MALDGLPRQPDRPSLNGGNGNGRSLKAASQLIAGKLAQADTQHQQAITQIDELAQKIESNATALESHVEKKMEEVDRKLADSFRNVEERIAATLDRFAANTFASFDAVEAVELAETVGSIN